MTPVTQRCPHCASPKIADGVCRACGRGINEAPDLPRIEDLEHTQLERREAAKRVAAAPVTSERIVCSECSVPNPPTRTLCVACGKRLNLPQDG